MTEPSSVLVALAAALVAAVAAWKHLPRTPELDGERWFKVLLATLLRGETERAGEGATEWVARVVRYVPYHPAGRLPEQKIEAPERYRPRGLSLPGELALVEALGNLSDRTARWVRMYDEDPAALDARLDDPVVLGGAYDPSTSLGVGGSWEAIVDWGAGRDGRFEEALRHRFSARWLLVDASSTGEDPEAVLLLGALEGLLSSSGAESRRPDGGSAAERLESLKGIFEAFVPEASDRMVVFVSGGDAWLSLRALTELPGIRDRVEAVVVSGGRFSGKAEIEEWMERHFTHDGLDTERHCLIPYFHLAWLDRRAEPIGAFGCPLASMRLPVPSREVGEREEIEIVDLGLLPIHSDLPHVQVARALVAVVGLWCLSRR